VARAPARRGVSWARVTVEELEQRLRDPGFTPSVKLVGALVERIARADPDVARLAGLALARIQAPVASRAARAMEGFAPRERAKVLSALGARRGHGEDAELLAVLGAALRDRDEPLRRIAVRALAKLGGQDAERELADAIERAASRSETVALLGALGKVGGLRAAAELARTEIDLPAVRKARLMVDRTLLRSEASSSVRLDLALPREARAFVSCRRGLEEIAKGELLAVSAAPAASVTLGYGRIELPWCDPLAKLTRVRTALRFGVTFSGPAGDGGDDAAHVVALLTSTPVRELLLRLTEGPIRFRLAWEDGRKRRAEIWSVAAEVRALAPELVNDPTQSAWDATVRPLEQHVEIDLAPRWQDDRFVYRTGDVPASSHPTIAAALARVAGARDDDVVWDPFAGSGLELCERSLLGPYRSLVGSDLDVRAVRRAEQNLRAVGAKQFAVRHEDAREASVQDLSCVLTNPPMGRRVLEGADIGALLAEVVTRAASMLRPGGRIVLLSPRAGATRRAAERAGLRTVLDRRVDMSGFDAVLQRFDDRRPRR